MITYVVVAAWERFCTIKQELIQKAFRDVGLSISPCGKDDHLLSIKGYDHGKPKIGDWSRIELIDSEFKDEVESFREVHRAGEDDILEYIHESEESISSDYTRLSKFQLLELCLERRLYTKVINMTKGEIRATLLEYDHTNR